MSEQSRLALRPQVPDREERILRSILSAIGTGILVTDLDHVTLACNRRFGEVFGVDIDLAVRSGVQDLRDMVSERISDLSAWTKNLEEVYSDPEATSDDSLVLNQPFSILSRHTCPVRDEDGRPFARLWMFEDVTDRHRRAEIEKILQEISHCFDPEPRRVYELILDRVASHYDGLTFLSVRKGDYMEFKAVGGANPVAKALPGNDLADSYCQFCLAANRPVLIQDASADPRHQSLLPYKFGLTRYAGVPLKAPDGTTIGTFCILDHHRDRLLDDNDLHFISLLAMRISTELEREAQLIKLQEDLRTTQSHLVQSEKLAITGTLAATVAHDIRNIVSAIRLDLGDSIQTESLGSLRTHMDRFNVLAHRLLSYAQPQEVRLQPVSVEDSLKRVDDLLYRHFEVAGIERRMAIEANLPSIVADPARLDHLFVNLCLNAIQVLPRGGEIAISAYRRRNCLVVEIQDNGPGFDPKLQDRAFLPFSSTRRDGFGLGLFSCRQIVSECGGKLSLDSRLGEGATFHMEFPIP